MFFKSLLAIYSYLNDCSPSRQFYTNLNILDNQLYMHNKIIVSEKIRSYSVSGFPVGMTNNQNKN